MLAATEQLSTNFRAAFAPPSTISSAACDAASLFAGVAVGAPTALDRDQGLFVEGDPADAAYLVLSGTMRIFKMMPDGRRQIVGFLEAGDFLGLAVSDVYAYSAEAVTPARLLRVSRARIEALMDEQPALRRRLLAIAANELIAAQDQMLLLGRKNAAEKVMSFLEDLAARARRRGDGCVICLPMSRSDIADYLGLTIETVSRTLTQLKNAGAIAMLDATRVRVAAPAGRA